MSKINIVVVSLFDGLSGGRIALDRTPHLNVLRYYSSEVDKYTIQIADKNYPQDTKYRLGSVVDIDGHSLLSDIRKEFGDVKILLIGGSPCQGFSMAGKLKGSSTKCGQDIVTLEQYLDLKEKDFEFYGQSYLFWEYIRIKQELNPDYFLLENVRVTKKWLPMFNEAMGVEPTRINSSLLSAQNRDRYYWHNFGEVSQPKDKGILLKDVLNSDYKMKELTGWFFKKWGEKRKIDMLRTIEAEKAFCVTTHKSHSKNYYLSPCKKKARMLQRDEVEKLQTLPTGYTDTVANIHAHKMIGNGWTIDVVAHIFGFIKDFDDIEEEIRADEF